MKVTVYDLILLQDIRGNNIFQEVIRPQNHSPDLSYQKDRYLFKKNGNLFGHALIKVRFEQRPIVQACLDFCVKMTLLLT